MRRHLRLADSLLDGHLQVDVNLHEDDSAEPSFKVDLYLHNTWATLRSPAEVRFVRDALDRVAKLAEAEDFE